MNENGQKTKKDMTLEEFEALIGQNVENAEEPEEDATEALLLSKLDDATVILIEDGENVYYAFELLFNSADDAEYFGELIELDDEINGVMYWVFDSDLRLCYIESGVLDIDYSYSQEGQTSVSEIEVFVTIQYTEELVSLPEDLESYISVK